jgi:hypothetical protein
MAKQLLKSLVSQAAVAASTGLAVAIGQTFPLRLRRPIAQPLLFAPVAPLAALNYPRALC